MTSASIKKHNDITPVGEQGLGKNQKTQRLGDRLRKAGAYKGGPMAGLSPTQRTRGELRKLGRHIGTVERWIPKPGMPGGGFRVDLFGFIDLIVMCPGRGIVGVQSCGNDFAAHYRKITEDCAEMAIEWLKCNAAIELWAWRKVAYKRGGKLKVWRPRVQEITFKDFDVKEQSIICPKCGMRSYNPNDIENQYCGNCHQFHEHFKWEAETA